MSNDRYGDDRVDEERSDMRRRAAWLLGMLALVAALFVVLMVVFFNNSGGGGKRHVDNLAVPTDSVAPSGSPSGSSRPLEPTGAVGSASSQTATGSAPGAPSSSASSSHHTTSCPDKNPCAFDDDIGNAVAAINAYREDHGKDTVPGEVSDAAKKCALNNGSGCSGGWAETQVAKANGKDAVQKILQFGKLLQDMKSVEVGWAYDPGAKQYYFALIRKD